MGVSSQIVVYLLTLKCVNFMMENGVNGMCVPKYPSSAGTDYCLMAETSPQTGDVMIERCTSKKNNLAKLHTIADMNNIGFELNSLFNNRGYQNSPVLIGLNDVQEEGKFVWVDGSQQESWMNSFWRAGEPNDVAFSLNGEIMFGADCTTLVIQSNGQFLSDSICSDAVYRYVLCEGKPPQSPLNHTYMLTNVPEYPSVSCDIGWFMSSLKTCYLVSYWQTGNASELSGFCESNSGNLGRIYSYEDIELTNNLLQNSGDDVLFGANDIQREGVFHWADGLKVDTLFSTWWEVDQPNNIGYYTYVDSNTNSFGFNADCCYLDGYDVIDGCCNRQFSVVLCEKGNNESKPHKIYADLFNKTTTNECFEYVNDRASTQFISTCPCQNGGTCELQTNPAQCDCSDGYSGEFCETNLLSSTRQPTTMGTTDVVTSSTAALETVDTTTITKNTSTPSNLTALTTTALVTENTAITTSSVITTFDDKRNTTSSTTNKASTESSSHSNIADATTIEAANESTTTIENELTSTLPLAEGYGNVTSTPSYNSQNATHKNSTYTSTTSYQTQSLTTVLTSADSVAVATHTSITTHWTVSTGNEAATTNTDTTMTTMIIETTTEANNTAETMPDSTTETSTSAAPSTTWTTVTTHALVTVTTNTNAQEIMTLTASFSSPHTTDSSTIRQPKAKSNRKIISATVNGRCGKQLEEAVGTLNRDYRVDIVDIKSTSRHKRSLISVYYATTSHIVLGGFSAVTIAVIYILVVVSDFKILVQSIKGNFTKEEPKS